MMKPYNACLIVIATAIAIHAAESHHALRVTTVNGIIQMVEPVDHRRMPSVSIQWHENGMPARFQETARRSHHWEDIHIRLAWYANGQKKEEWLPGPDGNIICREWDEDGTLVTDGVRAASRYPWSGTFQHWVRDNLFVRVAYTNGTVSACTIGEGWMPSRQWDTEISDPWGGGTMTFHAAFVEYCASAKGLAVRFMGERRPNPTPGAEASIMKAYRSDMFVVPLVDLSKDDIRYLKEHHNHGSLLTFGYRIDTMAIDGEMPPNKASDDIGANTPNPQR